MLKIGTHQVLEVNRLTDIGAVLRNEEGDEVLIPGKFLPKTALPGFMLRVFLYKDHLQRPIATTLEPLITLNTVAKLAVREVNDVGAFMLWGMEKDLLVPYREQIGRMNPGEEYLVYMYLDERTDRLAASAKLNHFLDNDDIRLEEGEEVDLVVWNRTDLGYNVIVNHKHIGLVYHNEVFSDLQPGDTTKGYVKMLRPDQKLDIVLQKQGYEHVEPNAQRILNMLNSSKGFLPFTDKSAPEDITAHFEMSKKTFKKALGSLYKQRLVRLEKDGIYALEVEGK